MGLQDVDGEFRGNVGRNSSGHCCINRLLDGSTVRILLYWPKMAWRFRFRVQGGPLIKNRSRALRRGGYPKTQRDKEQGHASINSGSRRSHGSATGAHAADETGNGRWPSGQRREAVRLAGGLAGSVDLLPDDRPVQQSGCATGKPAVRRSLRRVSGRNPQGHPRAAWLHQNPRRRCHLDHATLSKQTAAEWSIE